ncbi:histidine kinase [Stakelama marina]|uniref:Histidine kinase n=1 Tax=Stakelama marina TaxID=2826939 RepID=A0A8T4IBN8_9SPHN|nr:histidine kinase [Stakelama marina]MBR0551512.1 histidine kinase [Stakelama marina]
MWRYLAGAVSAMFFIAAGLLLYRGDAAPKQPLPGPPPSAAPVAGTAPDKVAVTAPPKATEKTREEKRFDRYDDNADEAITRDELLKSRRTRYANLDTDHDGKLSFREWAHTTYDKFDKADADKSGTLSRVEFATTRRKSKPKPRKPACSCAGD